MGHEMAKREILGDAELIGARLGERIKEVRTSPEKLAAELGVTRDTIYRAMRGETVLSWVKLARIANALKTTPNDLIGVVSGYNLEILESVLRASFAALSFPEQQARVFASIVVEAACKPPDQPPAITAEEYARVQITTAKKIFGCR
jgi:transcriptional regulator with XRE-family HTH domain